MTPEFARIAAALELDDPGRFLPADWERTRAARPETGAPFLSDAFVNEAAGSLDLRPEAAAALRQAAALMRGRPELEALARHCHVLFGERGGALKDPRWSVASLGPHAGMFPLLVLLSHLPRLKADHAARGIPAGVSAHTLSDIRIWMDVHRRERGAWGMDNLGWLACHFSGRLFRLGRLQAMLSTFHGNVTAYRNRKDGTLRMLARAGTVFRADGVIDGTSGLHDEAGRWTAAVEREAGRVRGSPVSPEGFAVREPVTMALAEWEPVLATGDPVLDLHIPEGEPLTREACLDSFGRMQAFFPRHFPEEPYRALTCSAWLLDPTYRELLPSSANLPRFQELFHPFPDWGDEKAAFYRVWGNPRIDPATAPRDTGLRRAIAEWYGRGRRLIGGGGGIVREAVLREVGGKAA